MAYVTGPLHSQQASGQIGHSQIFQTYNGKTYVKKYARPSNTPGTNKPNQSDAQLTHQAEFKVIADAWNAASDADKASWSDIATSDRISNYAAYTRENWKRYALGQSITTVWPAVDKTPTTFRILTGNSTTPAIETWCVTFSNGGNLTLNANDVIATNDLLLFETNHDFTLDGIFDFTGITALQELDLAYTAITTPPTLTDLTALQFLALNNIAITTPPTLTGLTALQFIDLSNNALHQVDSIFNDIAANNDTTAHGTIDVSGGSSAAPTAASAAAIAALTTNGGNWTIITN